LRLITQKDITTTTTTPKALGLPALSLCSRVVLAKQLIFIFVLSTMVHRPKGASRGPAVALFDIRYKFPALSGIPEQQNFRNAVTTCVCALCRFLFDKKLIVNHCRVGTNEKDVIVITPSELESAPTLVQGRVALSLNDSLSVRNITLRMYGVATVAYIP